MRLLFVRHTCSFLLSAVPATFLLVSTASAQNEPPSYQHLRELEPFIGRWATESDPSGNTPEGTLWVIYRWMGNKSYVQSEIYFRASGAPADKKLNPEFTVIGYDKDESATKAWMFKFLDQGKLDVMTSPRKYVVHQQEGEMGTRNYREQTSTYEIDEEDVQIVNTRSASAASDAREEPTLRLSREE